MNGVDAVCGVFFRWGVDKFCRRAFDFVDIVVFEGAV